MEFRVVESDADLLKAFIIRGIVFIEEQNCPYDDEIDQFEKDALHILGEVEGEPAACARIRFFEDTAKLERVAIRQRYRGKGAGRNLVEYMMQVAGERGAKKFKLHGQAHLQKFYESLGYSVVGDVFMECGIPHRLFVK